MSARRVLIVEDDAIIAAHLQDILRELGYETPPPLATGEAALAAVMAHPPDLVLMDIRLAGAISGIEAARRIQDACDIPVIYLTAYADAGQADQAIATSPYGYLVKPVDARELAVAVEVALHHHRLDRQLKESEAKYRTLVENVPGAVYRCDVDPPRRPSFLSDGMLALSGWPAADFVSGRVLWRDHVSPDDLAAADRAIADAIARRAPYEIEYRFRHADGSLRWIHDTGRCSFAPDGSPRCLDGVMLDVTDRKRAEVERLEMERRVLHAQKLESLGVLAGGIAHDFNNLLQAILGHLDLALYDAQVSPGTRAHLETAADAARSAADLTRQMLAYAGRGRFVMESIDLSALVVENLAMLRTVVPHTVSLITHLDPALPPIEADRGQMLQVVMNLITNAAEAIGDRDGRVIVTTGVQDCDADYLRQGRVEETPSPGRYVYLEVADTGCGMDEAVLERIFEPFFSTKFTGRGLGMAAVLGIVRGHHGTILLSSRVGQGSTVRVLFPAVTSQRAESLPPAAPPMRRPQPVPGAAEAGIILVVDDEESVRSLVAQWLQMIGFTVLTAADGAEALRLFQEHPAAFACVVLDLTMPHQDGVATFAQLRQVRPDIKVVLSSGYPAEEALQRFAGQGVAGFVQKPYTLDAMRAEVERVLGV
jgi:two-component system cell cycle sensor histidine kinase/response regulator CckA